MLETSPRPPNSTVNMDKVRKCPGSCCGKSTQVVWVACFLLPGALGWGWEDGVLRTPGDQQRRETVLWRAPEVIHVSSMI